MKPISYPFYLFIILALIVSGLQSCSSTKNKSSNTSTTKTEAKTVKLETNAWNTQQQKLAQQFGHRLLDACNTSRFKGYTKTEATPELIKSMSPEAIEQTCRKFNLRYGTYKGMKLVEVWYNPVDQTHIYRFKPSYSKKIAQKELRITMNADNLMSALSTLDWDANYGLTP